MRSHLVPIERRLPERPALQSCCARTEEGGGHGGHAAPARTERTFPSLQHLASVLDPGVTNMGVLEYFTRQLDQPHMVTQIIQVGLQGSSHPEVGLRGTTQDLLIHLVIYTGIWIGCFSGEPPSALPL